MPPEMAKKWFTPTGASRYRLNDLARAMVQFHRLNLLDEDYPEELSHQDIIMFRNVSIYFDADVRKSVQSKLAGLLNPGGALIVGLSETLANDFGQMAMASEDGIFYFVNAPVVVQPREMIKSAPSPTPTTSKSFPSPVRRPRIVSGNADKPVQTPIPEALKKTTPLPNSSIEEALSYLKDKRYDDALALIDQLESQDAVDVRLFVMRSLIAFNRKDFRGAQTAAERALTISEWNLDALFMLAQISRRNDDFAESERRLKQIIYNEPRCWPAHYWLAEVYRNKGDTDKAAREYRVVVNQTSGVCDAKGGLLLFPLGVSPAEVGGLCSHQLKSLGVTR
jgi:chemotaxis protein methyltransferase CheR